MKILHNSSSRLSKNSKNSGFTLIELLISSFMGILVIGAVGYGLTNILRGNRSNTIQTNKRTEFNRATSFISDEMRRANHIDVDPSTAYTNTLTELGITAPPNAQPILALNIPDVKHIKPLTGTQPVDKPIIYLVSDPASGDASVWSGPKVIYRIGPPSDGSGNFTYDPTNSTWALEPLVDGISANAATPSCDAGWTASPSADALGFYACIQPIATTDVLDTSAYNETEKGETAKLFAIGKLDPKNPSSKDYEASTQVFARAEEENLDGSNPDVAYTGACVFASGALSCPSISGGSSERTFSIERLADAFACRPDGTKWKVLVTAYYMDETDPANPVETYFPLVDSNGDEISGSTSENVNLDTTALDFKTTEAPLFRVTPDTANSPGCDPSTNSDVFSSSVQNQSPIASENADQFRLLEDADTIPPEFNNDAYLVTDINDPNKVQDSAQQILNNEGLIDPNQNTKINTGNDYLVAFEIGQDKPEIPAGPSGSLIPNPGYDFQDQVYKISVE